MTVGPAGVCGNGGARAEGGRWNGRLHVAGEVGPEAFKGVLANPADRRGPVEKLMAAIKLTLRDMFYSPDRRETVMICEGHYDDVTAYTMIGFATGAFQDTTIENLISTEAMTAAMVSAQKRASAYSAPNEDEIDRILLEE